jgi:hypothetical protein
MAEVPEEEDSLPEGNDTLEKKRKGTADSEDDELGRGGD